MARRIGWTILVLVVLIVVAITADVVSRARTESIIAAELRSSASAMSGVDVSIAGAAFLPQLFAGHFDQVTATADTLLVDGLELDDVHATLTDVSADDGTAGSILFTAQLTPAALTATVAPDLTYTIEDGALVATLASAPLAASLVPQANGAVIDLRVTELSLAGIVVAPEDLPLGLGAVFDDLAVDVDLPAGIRLDDVTVGSEALEVTVSGTDVLLSEF